FFFNDTATTEIYTLSLHDALPICLSAPKSSGCRSCSYSRGSSTERSVASARSEEHTSELPSHLNLVCRLLLGKYTERLIGGGAGLCVMRELRSLSEPAHVAASSAVRLLFFNDTATTEIYTLSLHDALPI